MALSLFSHGVSISLQTPSDTSKITFLPKTLIPAKTPLARKPLFAAALSAGFGVPSEDDPIRIPLRKTRPSLSESTIRDISELNSEPDWMLRFRLDAYRRFLSMTRPTWPDNRHPLLNLQFISCDHPATNLFKHFDGFGLALNDRHHLPDGTIGALLKTLTLKAAGVILCSISDAIREYPDLVRPYLGRVVPPGDNYYAALNSAVFSDGVFCYVPKNTTCPMDISTYFAFNAYQPWQFLRTLIVAEERSFVSYLEGCIAPSFEPYGHLHCAVVELYCAEDAEIRYSTLQNWYAGDKRQGKGPIYTWYAGEEEAKGGIYNFVTKSGLCDGARSKISWTQAEMGSAINWQHPSVVLRGDDTVGEFYSVVLTNNYQQADTGMKMIHEGKNSTSRVVSKGISVGRSRNSYRGVVQVMPLAENSSNFSQCDSMLIGENAAVNTYPCIQVKNPTARVKHEASTSKIGEDELFYYRQRGIHHEKAVAAMIAGFCQEVFDKLPVEFAAEANELISIKLEASFR